MMDNQQERTVTPKKREINECSTREARNRHRYNQIIFDKRAKTLQ